ncbi:hypothetical protein SPOG_05701 [Schizosaccharomyces cryophilus OY26]|uniref:Uncharacterized protein n=1 Tax=Schizosaccharomyces cryophilus (strain OY26 / ATCC MYA-4695 / CBS 11777 / NBRC 106824 / NRRL Y48691) TaxID=653667 RepID=S9VZY1_SCHCR|nr:uncharacterized protein SPOG_05701 [Schizosaccharomyces cryophilus OY26]EPY53248.1 hypothetical protein SPOG_05701 [Schizosaccharomyces cryophilus OY26]
MNMASINMQWENADSFCFLGAFFGEGRFCHMGRNGYLSVLSCICTKDTVCAFPKGLAAAHQVCSWFLV